MVQLSKLFGGNGFLSLLQFFLDNPKARASAADLGRKTMFSKRTLFAALSRLNKENFLEKEVVGRSILYSLNKNNPVVMEFKKLLTVSRLFLLLKPLKLGEAEVFLYGSAAKGEDSEESDVDLLVVGEGKLSDYKPLLRLRDEKIRICFFTPLEYAQLHKADKPFYESVERNKIRLV